ncbi:hypothetical protein OZX69_03005 [Lactobacillus sp. ESL0731]|uniref:hypothetical protein n=1 Tax=unclassified Lactobacillus TaxID=2620435 RepID=UPI0023F91381|nr:MULTISPECIES: hypothetical protein [unclassified Lactobacillus]WEV51679.1 hypothetical protein OZX63_03005 [Lactobacillus sp. ESL0700]WEV62808.1 hypothetical protein OZX69_03005 [Lactobacillus sp. ESL0731]
MDNDDRFAVYLTNYADNSTIELPLNPSDLKIKYESDDKTQTVINLGEINQLGPLKLSTIEIASTFPKDDHFVSTTDFQQPTYYIDWLKEIQKSKGRVQLVVASTELSRTMTIASFEPGFKDGYDGEYIYTLELKDYRKATYKKVKKKKKKRKSGHKKNRNSPAKKIGRGSTVIVNGRLHLDSDGRGPGAYEKNAKRKITNVATGHKYPIHVSTLSGGARGWVKKGDVKRA